MRIAQISRRTALMLIWCAAIVGCRQSEGEGTSTRSHAGTIERVAVGKPARKTLVVQTILPARIDAFEETPLYSKLAGYVDSVHVDIGDRVKKGDPLITLSVPELKDEVVREEAAVVLAKAEVRQAAAALDAAQAGAKTARAQIAEAKAVIDAAAGDAAQAESEHARIKQLAEGGSVTNQLLDEALNRNRSAAASQDAAAAAVESAEALALESEANVRKAEADQLAAEARVHVAEAALTRAQSMLSYTTISAPYDCVVTRRDVDPGHFVQPAAPGAKPLLVVTLANKLRVSIEVPEMHAPLVDVGDGVSLRVQAMPGRAINAPVARTSWALDASNRSLRAEVDVANDDAPLRAGMYGTAEITLARRDNALVIPATAVFREGEDAFCSCVESGNVRRQRLELGLRSGPEVEVLSGIDEATVVVIARGETLKDGQAVEVIAPKP